VEDKTGKQKKNLKNQQGQTPGEIYGGPREGATRGGESSKNAKKKGVTASIDTKFQVLGGGGGRAMEGDQALRRAIRKKKINLQGVKERTEKETNAPKNLAGEGGVGLLSWGNNEDSQEKTALRRKKELEKENSRLQGGSHGPKELEERERSPNKRRLFQI